MRGPCSMCEHFTMDPVEEKMRAAGWGVCLERGAGVKVYQSQAASCDFEPVRFLAREAPASALDPRYPPEEPPPGEYDDEDEDNVGLDLPEEIDFG